MNSQGLGVAQAFGNLTQADGEDLTPEELEVMARVQQEDEKRREALFLK